MEPFNNMGKIIGYIIFLFGIYVVVNFYLNYSERQERIEQRDKEFKATIKQWKQEREEDRARVLKCFGGENNLISEIDKEFADQSRAHSYFLKYRGKKSNLLFFEIKYNDGGSRGILLQNDNEYAKWYKKTLKEKCNITTSYHHPFTDSTPYSF